MMKAQSMLVVVIVSCGSFLGGTRSSVREAAVQGDEEQLDRVEQLFVTLGTMETYRSAVEALGQTEASLWVPDLVERLGTNGEYVREGWLRSVSIGLLIEHGLEAGSDGATYYRGDVAEVLVRTVSDQDGENRHACIAAIPHVHPKHAVGVVAVLIDLLDDEDSRLITAAAEALGRMGERARVALPALKVLLESTTQSELDRWNARLEAEVKRWEGFDVPAGYEFREAEIDARAAAAFARNEIGGFGNDLKLYPKLDWRGQVAALDALRIPFEQLQMVPGRAPSIDDQEANLLVNFFAAVSAEESIPDSDCAKSVAYLSVLAGNTKTTAATRSRCVQELIRILDSERVEERKAAKEALKYLGEQR